MRNGHEELAKAATKEEIWDNLNVWLPKAKAEAEEQQREFYVSWDNATTHKFANRLHLLGLRPDQYMELPARSPDLHQIIEHPFSQLKTFLVSQMYSQRWEVDNDWILDRVLSWCESISAAKIQGNLQLMPMLYNAVCTPKGQTINVGNHAVEGTGGYYTKHAIS